MAETKKNDEKTAGKNISLGLVRRLKKAGPRKQHRLGRTIAVSITGTAITFVTHKRGLTGSRLINISRVPISTDISTDDARQTFANNIISDYLNQHHRPMTKIIMGGGDTDSAFRIINLPVMPAKDIPGAIYWEADKQIPFKLDRAYYGYNILSDKTGSSPEGSHISVAVTAIQSQGIDIYLKLLKTAGLDVSAVHSEIESIGYLLPQFEDYKHDNIYIMVNARSDKTEICFYEGSQLTFVHTIGLGAPASDDAVIGDSAKDRYIDTLLAEMQNSLDYYAGLHPSATPKIIYIYGEFKCSDQIINELTDRFGIPFGRIEQNSCKNSVINANISETDMVRSLGTVALAMADFKLIDFLPDGLKEIKAEKRFYRFAVPAMAVMVFCLLGIWMTWKSEVNIDQSRLNKLNEQISAFTNSQSYTIYHQVKRQIANDQNLLRMLESNPTFLNLNLKELSRITPYKIRLNNYDLNNDKGQLDLALVGRVLSNDPPPEVVLAEYIAKLEKSPFFDLVTLKKHTKKYDKGNFVVDFHIDMKAVL